MKTILEEINLIALGVTVVVVSLMIGCFFSETARILTVLLIVLSVILGIGILVYNGIDFLVESITDEIDYIKRRNGWK